jgi:aerobic-type carbon monoxide dehydrogenase small subunit (CoxS/CutS family)
MTGTVAFTLNDQPVTLQVDRDRPLLWVLRADLGLTGAKFGCGQGLCGACTVLINGEAFPACQTAVGDISGSRVMTIEGLGQNGRLHPIQEAFVAHDALQCGFCTPGMILKAHSLLTANPKPTREEIVKAMEYQLCRCGAHVRIVEAIQTAAQALKGGPP